MFAPTSCSSNPGMKDPDPIVHQVPPQRRRSAGLCGFQGNYRAAKRIICSFTTVKCFAIDKTFEIQCYFISVCNGSVIHIQYSGVFFLFFSQFACDLFFCYFQICFRNFQSFVLTQSYFRFQSNFCCEDERFSAFQLCNSDRRLRYDCFFTLIQCFGVCFRNQSIGCIFILILFFCFWYAP